VSSTATRCNQSHGSNRPTLVLLNGFKPSLRGVSLAAGPSGETEAAQIDARLLIVVSAKSHKSCRVPAIVQFQVVCEQLFRDFVTHRTFSGNVQQPTQL
jgi:hypothetical protein